MDLDLHLRTLEHVLRSVDDADTFALRDLILAAQRVHLAGEGRSGLLAASFASHLTELGVDCELHGSPTASRPREGSLLLVCSGSGQTPGMAIAAEAAARDGARVALVTSGVISPLARIAHLRILLLPPFIPPEQRVTNAGLIREVRSLFEQAVFLYFARLSRLLAVATGQSPEDLESRRPG